MEFYKKPSIAVLIPIVLMFLVYGISSMSALSTPDASRFLQNTTSDEMLALLTKCTCMEGNIFCSDAEALEHCKCEGSGDAMMVSCEADHDDHDDHDDHHDDHDDHDGHDHDDHGHAHHDDHDSHDDDDGSKPWWKVIWVSIIINLTTLTGVAVVGGHWLRKMLCPTWDPDPAIGRLWANVIIPMFASGALMATSFFLLLPEALHVIHDGLAERLGVESGHHDHRHRLLGGGDDSEPHVEEADITWRWGASILGGFLFPVFLHAVFPTATDGHHHHHHPEIAPVANGTTGNEDPESNPTANGEETAVANGDDGDDDAPLKKDDIGVTSKTEAGSDDAASDEDEYITFCCIRLKNLPLFLSFNLGEMLHNFTDGIFVGAAYIGCSEVMGNSVAIATIVHEIPNQLAGYLVMVHQNGIHPITALVVNFIFGMIVLLGALIVLVATPGNVAVGSIFAIGAGIFIHVAIFEMLGTAERNIERSMWWVYVFLSFLVGAVCIGLVLANHEHCGGDH